MKLDFSVAIYNIDGSPALRGGSDEQLKVKDVVVELLYYSPEGKLGGKEQIERDLLAEKVYLANSEAEFSLDEVNLMKRVLEQKNPLHARIVSKALQVLQTLDGGKKNEHGK